MSKNIKWYSLDEILKYDAQYYIIYGERSNGKSFAVDKYMIDRFYQYGEMFAFVKRYEEDIKSKYMEEVIPLELHQYVEESFGQKIKFYRGTWYSYPTESEGKIKDCTPMGIAFSLANVNRTKATTYPLVTTILFEEFMSIDCSYLKDELNLLLNLISTIVRHRHNVKIFMLANAISKYSPYSDALKIRLHRLEKGKIITREYKDDSGFKTKFVIQRTENVNVFDNSENKNKIVYNNFGLSGVGKMITTGDFEVHAYKRRVGNVTFEENKQSNEDKIIGKKNSIPFILKFEDYYYRIYLYYDNKYIVAFREVEKESIKDKNTCYIINGIDGDIKGITSINNVASYYDVNINEILNTIVRCMKQGDFITLSDDDGENVVSGFRLSGVTL